MHCSYWLLGICLSVFLNGNIIAAADVVSHPLSLDNKVTIRSLQSISDPPPGNVITTGELITDNSLESAEKSAEEIADSSASGRLHLFFVFVSFLGNAAFMIFVFWLSK